MTDSSTLAGREPSEGNSAAAAPPRWLVLAALAVFAMADLVYVHKWASRWLEDFPVYKSALKAFSAGADPYTPVVNGLHFVYPPVVLYALAALAKVFSGGMVWTALTALHVACVLATPWVLARYYLRRPWLTPPMAALVWLAEPGFTGVLALLSGNAAPALYLAALLAAVPGFGRDRWRWFFAVVFLASLVKITLLVLLLLPLLLGRRQWLGSAATAAATAAAYAAQQHGMKLLYAGYQSAVHEQLVVQGQYGYGILGMAATVERKIRHDHTWGAGAWGVQALFTIAVCAVLFWLQRRGAASLSGDGETLWRGAVVIAMVVVNPRVLHYDIYIALFAAFVVLAATLRLQGWKLVALVAALFLPALARLPGIHPWLIYQTCELFLVLAALAAALWRLGRITADQ